MKSFHDLIKGHEKFNKAGGEGFTYRLGLTIVPGLSCLT